MFLFEVVSKKSLHTACHLSPTSCFFYSSPSTQNCLFQGLQVWMIVPPPWIAIPFVEKLLGDLLSCNHWFVSYTLQLKLLKDVGWRIWHFAMQLSWQLSTFFNMCLTICLSVCCCFLSLKIKHVPAYALCTQKCTFSLVIKQVFNIFDPKILDKMFWLVWCLVGFWGIKGRWSMSDV